MPDRDELALEQAHVDRAYDRLETRRRVAVGAPPPPVSDSAGAVLERDELAAVRARRLDALKLGDLPLCFGRIDFANDDSWHIGRLAVDDEVGDPLVVDWRAPIAEPFYRAVRSDPLGLARRRHLRCRAWTVLALDDELFDDEGDDDDVVVGEAALLRAIRRRRSGRMGDIVATIQSAQDEVIRAPLDQTLVVQGGPGTGKTAVALHRLAYLLYTHREALQAKGVLVIGPNATFLRYIERVLPSLGEQGTTLTTVAALRGGHRSGRPEAHSSAQVKGDLRMVDVVGGAVVSRQRPLTNSVIVPFGAYRLRFGVAASAAIVDRAHVLSGTHNHRRATVERLVLNHLHRVYVQALDRARLTNKHPTALLSREEFRETALRVPATQRLLDRLWPVLTPEQLLGDLLSHRALLREAADGVLSDEEQEAILREPDREGWSDADVALLDEASVHLGVPPRRPARRVHVEDRDWMADRVLEGVAADADISLSVSLAADIRERILNDEVGKPEAPPQWTRKTYGHVVVDEAQDLSPMQWRMVARRCPSGSMTLVGDLDQASGGWQLSWDAVLAAASPDAPAEARRVAELTVNYRTPAEVMELAGRVLSPARPGRQAPSSIRECGHRPTFERATHELVAASAARAAGRLLREVEGGTVAVIAKEALHAELRAALDACEDTARRGVETLDDPVAVLSTARSKGLEFDGVVVVEPQAIVDASPAGDFALYIALTRTTDRLHIVHSSPLPDALSIGLESAQVGSAGGHVG